MFIEMTSDLCWKMRSPELFWKLQLKEFSIESALVRKTNKMVLHGRVQVQLHVEDCRLVSPG